MTLEEFRQDQHELENDYVFDLFCGRVELALTTQREKLRRLKAYAAGLDIYAESCYSQGPSTHLLAS